MCVCVCSIERRPNNGDGQANQLGDGGSCMGKVTCNEYLSRSKNWSKKLMVISFRGF